MKLGNVEYVAGNTEHICTCVSDPGRLIFGPPGFHAWIRAAVHIFNDNKSGLSYVARHELSRLVDRLGRDLPLPPRRAA